MNKMLLDLLRAQNYCARTLILEMAIANAVVENTKKFGGQYVPPKGMFFFVAIDNTDFAEDTVDGKGTTHGTITAVYQKADAPGEPIALNLELCNTQDLSFLPYHVPMEPCSKPKPRSDKREQEYEVGPTSVADYNELVTLGWMIASALSRSAVGESEGKWAGYITCVITQVGALPHFQRLHMSGLQC